MREAIVVALRGENDAGRLDDPIQLVLRHCMLPVAMDPRKTSVLLLAVALSCAPKERPLAPRSQTWGELRLLRGTGRVSPPGENERSPYLRERLADGVRIRLDNHALAWCRQDRGATLLVRGPARFVFRPDSLDFDEGRVFIDSPGVDATSVRTPSGPVKLLGVRASLDVTAAQTVGYVLSGEVDLGSDTHAAPGERFVVAAASVTTSPAVVWEDWTGGLATTTRGPEPPPFGVGTVGARRPGDQGLPRVPLAVQRFDLRVTVEDELATTEVDEVFFNGTSDKVEGIYTFRTPVGASLLRFGVDRGGGIVWGRVKEKKAALAQYTSHVYAGSTEDPALLEWDSPGVYKARLYPVDPGETRRVVVRYTEWLPRSGSRGERRLYVFPMAAEGSDASIPHIEAFGATFDLTRAQAQDVRVGMAGVRQGERIVVRARDLVPRADLALELFDNGVQGVRAYRAPHEVDTEVLAPNDRREAERTAKGESDYLVVPLAESTVSAAEPGIDLALVVDTSAGTEPGAMALARAAALGLLTHLGPADRVVVWAGDTALRPVLEGRDGLGPVDEPLRQALSTALARVERGGATDIGSMLALAAERLDPARRGAVVYLGDGRPTVGELRVTELVERLGKLPRPPRIFGLGLGTDADMTLLSAISRGGFAERIEHASTAARAALRVLEAAERASDVAVTLDLGPNVERVVPRVAGASSDAGVFVGRLKGAPPSTLEIVTSSGKKSLPVTVQTLRDGSDLRVRWADGRLQQLLAEGAGRAALVELGVRSGIITPVTSLYVPTQGEMSSEELDELARRRRTRVSIDTTPLVFAGCSKREGASATGGEETERDPNDRKQGGSGTRAKSEEGAMGAAQATVASPSPPPMARPAAPSDDRQPVAQAHAAASAAPQAKDRAAEAVAEPETKPSPQKAPSLGYRGTGKGGGGAARGAPMGGMGGSGGEAGKAGNLFGASLGDEFGAAPPKPDRKAVLLRSPIIDIQLSIDRIDHTVVFCSDASGQPLFERMALWRERLAKVRGNPSAVHTTYLQAIRLCEVPWWPERAMFLSLLLDALPSAAQRVALWRMFSGQEADTIYRGIISRTRTPNEARELHTALGLKAVDPAVLDALVRAPIPTVERVAKLRALSEEWPDDFAVALALLDALEDASDDAGARDLARRLRTRPDADALIRTSVGELYLRLAKRTPARASSDELEARRTFGEIVEFAPDEPVARRRLGDLLRAHGWFPEAVRQYETLARLAPDDPTVELLLAQSAERLGKLEEAVRRAETVSGRGSPEGTRGLAHTARAFAATFLAWGRQKETGDMAARLRGRSLRLLGKGDRAPNSARVVLTWVHPELHPTLWTNTLGAMMPAPDTDSVLGFSQSLVATSGGMLEVRVEPGDVARTARLGAEAWLTVLFDEASDSERIVSFPVVFKHPGPSAVRFTLNGKVVGQ